MRLRHLKSSSVVVEDGDMSVLCDPWLLDGAFYGAWAHYPPLEFEPSDYNDVDYIYISHIHPDHCHGDTLERLDDDIPVLIHDYQSDFLRHNVEAHGFDVKELPHNERVHLGGDLHLNVLGADNCNPEKCGKYFGCSWWMESESGGRTDGSTQIDSMGVFDDGDSVLVNANDCRWPMSAGACGEINDRYGEIDMLLMQYGAANFYPQCMADYTHAEKLEAKADVAVEMLQDAESFIDVLEPDYYMPFAGSYVLAGDNADLNEYLAVARRDEAKDYFERSDAVPDSSVCVLLNSEEHFDLDAERQSAPYTPIDEQEKAEYIETVLADRDFTFESDPMPDRETFRELIPEAYEHFEVKRQDLGYESETTVYLQLVDDEFAKISMQGDGFEFVGVDEYESAEEYVRMDIDPRLLVRILQGPRYAHFNNAQIGSHIMFHKDPDVYERPLYYAMSFFHTPA
ncbi:MBL fold metallo-hydrolase [Halorientalis brevis]|uniref:MBL fold metallo-hydrolase n=1 Tax=Halorientalis brevis TaxID=1126241 RepID=A0ABD6CDN6_9EURY|nr:MBL fold metallo-hydrolase [Halorientalis brevis]